MSWLAQALIAGITSFVATNIDDIVILMLFFSQVNGGFRRRHIVAGQYLGFMVLLAASLPGFFGGLLIPKVWIGLLGLLPLAIGIYQLIHPDQDQAQVQTVPNEVMTATANSSIAATVMSVLDAKTYHVAAVTVANGGDNIGIYVPLFASSDLPSLGIVLSTFLIMVGVWCCIGDQLARHPAIAPVLTRYGKAIVPFVLIGLGVYILVESGSYQLLPLFHSRAT